MSKFWAPHLHAHTVGYLYDNFASGLVLVIQSSHNISLMCAQHSQQYHYPPGNL